MSADLKKHAKGVAKGASVASILTFITYLTFHEWLLPKYEWDAGKIAVVGSLWGAVVTGLEWIYHRFK